MVAHADDPGATRTEMTEALEHLVDGLLVRNGN